MRAWIVAVAVVFVAACSAGADRGRGGPVDGGPGVDASAAADGGGGDAGPCGPGATLCGGMCIPTSGDRMNCGACGHVCAAGEVCSEGACGTTCTGTASTRCGDECVDTMIDPAHCGTCDTACDTGLFCTGGHCMLSCGEFADRCGDVCTDVRTDPLNCGMCGHACDDPPHSSPTCMASTCGYTCDTGYGDCNGLATDGCEVELATDLMHCGSCPMVCPTPAHASPTCAAGACGYTCDAGWADCNGLAVDGCEADLTLPSSCGSCTPCATGAMCVAGMCSMPGGRCYGGPARVLAYGPGLTGGITMVGAGAVVTVATEAMWSAMTTADFGNYDIIWLDGATCGSATAGATYGTAEDTIGVWGPAIRGRVEIIIGDPDYHGGPWATLFHQNSARWLKELGRNVDGGRTSLYINWGCTVYNSNTMGMVPGRGTPEAFTAVLGAPITTDTTNFCAATTTAAGAAHPVLAGMTSYWDCPMHGGFSVMPAGFVALSTGTPGGTPTLAVRDVTMPCLP